MCGICGKLAFGPRPIDLELIRSMCRTIAVRGPDGMGIHVNAPGDLCDHAVQVGLGHQRLSIIDLTPAAGQPMSNEDGTVWLTYNGEIYNFRELRAELAAKGHCFRSESDTEVLIHLYEEEGIHAVRRLNGMFAFALWDEVRQRLWLCRDRIGVKPLVYYQDDSTLVFASEIKALLVDRDVRRKMDPNALMLYLSFNYIPAPLTIFKDIRKLEPGCSLVVEGGKGEIQRYWNPPVSPVIPDEGYDGSIKRHLMEALSDAVSGCMLADVPVGAFLSGGIDSGIVVALMARLSQKPVRTFTIGFRDLGRGDETHHARKVARMYDTEHHEIRISERDMLEVLAEVLDTMDEPLADSSAIPTFLVARETRRHVTVALSGDGGDELFAGYRSYLSEYWRGKYLVIPSILRGSILEPFIESLPDSRDTRVGETVRRMKKFFRAARGPFEERLLALKEVFPAGVRQQLLTHTESGGDPALVWVRCLLERSSGDAINRMLYTDLVDSLPGDMLAKVDLMSMRNSLEVRVPLLDHRVVEMALQIPGARKLHRGNMKHELKEACKDLLPPGHTRLPKVGFEIPISRWLRKDLSSLIDRYLAEERIRGQGVFEYSVIDDLIQKHRRRRADTSWMLWNLIVFQRWYEAYA